ncbi:MAG TPA: sulfatase-like hydrolase/transferase [Candidatus Sulfotelmatobacter sp.]|nr:sulfatase-like hydrolase/transferase [Candidatus Sulfotelmatobacter sp.]
MLLVFLLAKLVIVWGHAAPVTGWSLLAYVWQDVMVALAFGALDIALQRIRAATRIVWAIYWSIAIYTAINIPVGRVVSTPLTRPMLRAARGPLADSMLVYLTPTNILLVVSVLAAAAGLPWLICRVPQQFARLAVVCAIAVVLLGPMASSRADTRGMDRNVVTALIDSGLPRVIAGAGASEWRESRFEVDRTGDLSRFAGAAQGRNLVMVSLESTAAQYLSLYGGEYEVMPNLSALARRALVFENAYAVYPESIKGLFSVLCSTFPAFDSEPEEYANLKCRSVASVLGDAGYRTAMFHSGRFGYLGMDSIIRHRGYQTLEDAGDIAGSHNSSFGVDEPATVARILAWIDALPRGQHFFLTYLPIAGHHPYATPEPGPFAATAEIDQYRNALHYGDVSLGALIEGLRARGLEQNTVWVIYGDHGEAFHQHEGNYGHTFFLYDENIHVPFLIAAPGLLRAQERVRKVVSLVDTAPTVLDLMGIAPPKNYQGRTMLDAAPRMALFFADYSLGLLGLRDGRWKFVYEIGSGRAQLFDLERDPKEMSDVSAREAARASWYGQVVRGWCNAQKSYIARAAIP